MWGFEFLKNLLPHVWGDWNEGELKCWYDLVRRLCVYGDCSLMDCFHCPPFFALLQALGGWPAKAVSTGSLPVWLLVWWSSGSPRRPALQGGVWEECFSSYLSAGWPMGSLSSISGSATQPFQTLIPITTFSPTPSSLPGGVTIYCHHQSWVTDFFLVVSLFPAYT